MGMQNQLKCALLIECCFILYVNGNLLNNEYKYLDSFMSIVTGFVSIVSRHILVCGTVGNETTENTGDGGGHVLISRTKTWQMKNKNL